MLAVGPEPCLETFRFVPEVTAAPKPPPDNIRQLARWSSKRASCMLSRCKYFLPFFYFFSLNTVCFHKTTRRLQVVNSRELNYLRAVPWGHAIWYRGTSLLESLGWISQEVFQFPCQCRFLSSWCMHEIFRLFAVQLFISCGRISVYSRCTAKENVGKIEFLMLCHPVVTVSCSRCSQPRSRFGAKLFNYERRIPHLGICSAAACRIQASKAPLGSCRQALPGFLARGCVRVAVPHDPTAHGAGPCGVPVSLGPRVTG